VFLFHRLIADAAWNEILSETAAAWLPVQEGQLILADAAPEVLRKSVGVAIDDMIAQDDHIHVGPQEATDRFIRRPHDWLVLIQ
jgi:hypothetical protein